MKNHTSQCSRTGNMIDKSAETDKNRGSLLPPNCILKTLVSLGSPFLEQYPQN